MYTYYYEKFTPINISSSILFRLSKNVCIKYLRIWNTWIHIFSNVETWLNVWCLRRLHYIREKIASQEWRYRDQTNIFKAERVIKKNKQKCRKKNSWKKLEKQFQEQENRDDPAYGAGVIIIISSGSGFYPLDTSACKTFFVPPDSST